MSNFRYYNGDEMYTDENGTEVIEYLMEVDDEQYPLTTLTTLTTYMDLKPPEKSKKPIARMKTIPKKKEGMEKFYFLVLEKGMSIRGAAKELNLPGTTAQSW
ncbi:hypothetical protein BD770DRAFT_411750 [Pilaira anomala]|nr:hypothetical protein BD770DRAFT_411750 [Pilaira anomala]